MIDIARDILNALNTEQRQEMLLAFDGSDRHDWNYPPRPRPGLPLKNMTGEQRDLVWRLLDAALSEQGRRKAREVIQFEAILGELTGNPDFRDPENYALAVFGEPSEDAPWSWRFEGHHLSLTLTLVPGEGIAVTPAFFGANPAEVPQGHPHAGLRLLKDEHNLAFALLGSLTDRQQQSVLLQPSTFGDILTGPGREDSLTQPQGLSLTDLTDPQRDMTLKLIDSYLGNLRPDLAQQQQNRLRQAGLDKLHFAWAGAHTPEAPHYYRLHGPTALIEYDNTQNGANHAHSVWHEPMNAFGEDLLRRHRERDH